MNEQDLSDKGSYPRTNDFLDLDHQAVVHQGRAAALQAVDESVAEILRALRQRRALANTVLIFSSDNGFFLGEHRMVDKRFPYDEAMRVPLLVRGPGFPVGQPRHQPVGLVDLPATALHLSGARPVIDGARVRQDGVQLLEVAQDPSFLANRVMPIESGPERAIQSQVVTPVPDWYYRGAKTSRYSYISWDMGKETEREEELYDRDVDPYQLDGRPDAKPLSVLEAMRLASFGMEDCAGRACVRELPDLDAGTPPTAGDSAPPRIKVHAKPEGWVRTTTPLLRFSATDPDGDRLKFWCSHHASGCATGHARYQLAGEGRHYWSLFVGDSEGTIASRAGVVQVDLTKPFVRRHGRRYGLPQHAPLLRWRLTDHDSGVATMDLRRSIASLRTGFDAWRLPDAWHDRESSSIRAFPFRPGWTVCVQARATDAAGWQSGWAGSTCRRGTPGRSEGR
ncbi:MAG: sulfatase-like hydrolase/transferase [Nocardioidaceae bacterium]